MKNQTNLMALDNIPSTNVNININMDECEVIKTETKVMSVSLDIARGFNVQYASSKQQSLKKVE